MILLIQCTDRMRKPSVYTWDVAVAAVAALFAIVEGVAACDTENERGPLVCED